MKTKDTKDCKDRKRMGASVLGVLAVLSSTPLAAQQAPGFGEVVEVNVVNVDVYVTGKDGKPVAGLGKADFEVFEDGRRVEITNFAAVDRNPGAGASAAAPAPAAPAPPAGEAADAAPEAGLHLVVYVDNANIRHGNRARAVQQLREFLTRQLVPGDRVLIASNDIGGMNVRLPFSSDPAALSAALDRLGTVSVQGDEEERARRQAFQQIMTIQELALLNPIEPPCPLQIASPAHSYATAKRQEVLRTLGALTLMVNSLSGVSGRKALLHVSDGISLSPGAELFELLFQMCGGGGASSGFGSAPAPGAPDDAVNTIFDSRTLGPGSYQAASQAALDAQAYNVANDVERLAAHANAHRVTLYTLEASGAQASAAADASLGPNERLFQIPAIGQVLKANQQDTLQALASATGGRAFLNTTNFLPDLALMRQDFDRYYSLGYMPAHSGDGKAHRIEVKVKRPGLKARSRQSYRDKPVLERTVDRTLAALFYGIQDNPLEVTLEIGEPTSEAGGRYLVPVKLRIPLFKLGILNDQEKYKGRIRLFVATRGDKGMTPVRQVEVPFEIPRAQVLTAMGQFYGYTLSLQMLPGEQQIAVAVRDETTTTTSYLSRAVNVGAVATASQNR